jgi:MFS family permease
MADWSAVYLRDIVGADASQAALGYAAFSLTMTGMRLLGDQLTQRWGAMRLLRWLNAGGASALALALVFGEYGMTLVAFAFTGLGVATVAPTVFSAAARRAGSAAAGRGIAAVAVYGYTGFLAGPPLIGWLAQATSLRSALAVLALLACVIVALSSQLHEDTEHATH